VGLDPFLTMTRVSDSVALTIYGEAVFERDASANLTVSWEDPLLTRDPAARLTRADLEGFISENVEQQRNRAGAYLCLTDPLGVLLRVQWGEGDPWAGALLATQELYAVGVLSGASASLRGDRMSLVFYRADYRFGRGSGLLQTRPSPP